MTKLKEDKTVFKYHRYALYATDVTFQQANRPSGNHEESKKYFSNKHKLYGYKTEASVLPNGLCINFFTHFPGFTSDITIFRENEQFHVNALAKTRDEEADVDNGSGSDLFTGLWAVVLDKGYQGAQELLRTVIPKKKPVRAELCRDDERKNRKIATDRIIVENYFGRVCVLWAVVRCKFRWDEKHYARFVRICFALTNAHIKWHPLRDVDGAQYQKYRKRLHGIAENTIQKRSLAQQRYRAKRRARLARDFSIAQHEEGAGALYDLLDE